MYHVQSPYWQCLTTLGVEFWVDKGGGHVALLLIGKGLWEVGLPVARC